MKRICTLCGQGLGSSLIVELNVKKALETLNVPEGTFEVSHSNLNSYSPNDGFDYIICGLDLADQIDAGKGQKIILSNIMDVNEITQKLKEIL
ncbi:MAG: PTS sugar transporter subunit IIB [Mycoplasmoidaceae bacterium]